MPFQKRIDVMKGIDEAGYSNGTVSWERRGEPVFSMGEGTLRVPMSMHAGHRAKVCDALRSSCSDGDVLFLQGGSALPLYTSDTDWGFRQESNFQYLFGVKEQGVLGAIRVQDGRALLFIPELAQEYQKWLGPIKPPAWWQRAYGVDEVHLAAAVGDVLGALGAKRLLVPRGTELDSGIETPGLSFEGCQQLLDLCPPAPEALCRQAWVALCEARARKSPGELEIMQYVNDVSCRAHVEVMRSVKAGEREFVAEATFKYQSMLRGCARVGYGCICPAGPRAAILHYGHENEPNAELAQGTDMRLHDMGAEYHCYCADVTVSFPMNGRFTEGQRAVYEAVWAATLAVERAVRPGVDYKDMHRLAQRVLLEEMKGAGLFVGEVDDMVRAGLMSYFFPHGLGHQLGLQVHDVAGYPPGGSRADDPSIVENLRCGRVLEENMVITVEPGFYFVDYLVEELLSIPELAALVNAERLSELWAEVGGVRIEDDVVVTAGGCRVLTCVPRTVAEIEAVMAGQEWTVTQSACRVYGAAA